MPFQRPSNDNCETRPTTAETILAAVQFIRLRLCRETNRVTILKAIGWSFSDERHNVSISEHR
jgi:hypothetical protein